MLHSIVNVLVRERGVLAGTDFKRQELVIHQCIGMIFESVRDFRQAFDDYLDESAKGYVYRHEPTFAEGVRRIREAGGIASMAHPVRVKGDVPAMMQELADDGMNAIEAYHSDHTEADTNLYLSLAKQYGLLVTGGSDYHGTVKPGVKLGTGAGNLRIPEDMMERLRERFDAETQKR